jgi:2-oxoglutarate ferredoxin oxidoreductase subunit delta
MPVTTEKKKARGSVVIIAERCKGCGFCVEFCPPKALNLSEQYTPKGYHPPVLISEELCTGCNICGLMCPDFAIYGFIYRKKKARVEHEG